MNLLNFLPMIGNAIPLAGPGGFNGPIGGMDESGALGGVSPMAQAIAQAPNPATQKPSRPPGMPSPFLHTLGMIGDALIQWRGGQPMYAPQLQQRQTSAALNNYLDDPEGAIRSLMGVNPQLALQLHQGRQGKDPEEIALMKLVGIDPNSEQGRQIITSRLMGRQSSNEPNFIRELDALGIDPGSDEARELYYGRNSPAGYLLKPPPRGAQQGGMPRVSSPEEASKLPPGTRFLMPDGRVGTVPGGPTGAPSASFP